MQPRTRRHLRTRQAILDAALDIINQEGPDALPMRSLAECIDYRPAGLYEYFGSKEEIISAVCEEGQHALYEAMSQVNPMLPPSVNLYEIGQAYIRFALAHPDYFLMMFTLTPPAPTSYMATECQPEKAQTPHCLRFAGAGSPARPGCWRFSGTAWLWSGGNHLCRLGAGSRHCHAAHHRPARLTERPVYQ